MKYVEITIFALLLVGISCIMVFYRPAFLEVELNQEFRLEKNSIASIKDEDISIKITGFVNSPCGDGNTCIWSGLMVNYVLTYMGKEYDSDYKIPYRIEIINSNYKSFAILKITKKTR